MGDVTEARPVCQANCTEADAEFAQFQRVGSSSRDEYVCVSACDSKLFTFYEVGVQKYVCEMECPETTPVFVEEQGVCRKC